MSTIDNTPLLPQRLVGTGEDGDPYRLVPVTPGVAQLDQMEAAAAEARTFVTTIATEGGGEVRDDDMPGALGRMMSAPWAIWPSCEHLEATRGGEVGFVCLSHRTAAWCAGCASSGAEAFREYTRSRICDVCHKHQRPENLNFVSTQAGQLVLMGTVCDRCMADDEAGAL